MSRGQKKKTVEEGTQFFNFHRFDSLLLLPNVSKHWFIQPAISVLIFHRDPVQFGREGRGREKIWRALQKTKKKKKYKTSVPAQKKNRSRPKSRVKDQNTGEVGAIIVNKAVSLEIGDRIGEGFSNLEKKGRQGAKVDRLSGRQRLWSKTRRRNAGYITCRHVSWFIGGGMCWQRNSVWCS